MDIQTFKIKRVTFNRITTSWIIQILTLTYKLRLLKDKVKNYKRISKILLVAFDRQKTSYQNLSDQFLYIT